MKRSFFVFSILLGAVLLLPPATSAQEPWSGIINSPRATDWTHAGTTIPSASWPQCGPTIAAYGSSSSPASPATINDAIYGTGSGYTGCTTPHVIVLGSGDFYLDGGIDFATHSNVVLRGQGASNTRLHFSAVAGCNGWNAAVCLEGSNTYDAGGYTVTDWTGGFSQGSTTITLSSVSGIVLNLTPIVLDQCETGLIGTVGSDTCSGTATDNGGFFVCDTAPTCITQSPTTGIYRSNRAQAEVVVATACTATTGTCTTGTGPYTLTLSSATPIRNPNWSVSQAPRAWWGSATITNSGVEDLLIDASTTGQRSVALLTSNGVWVKGIASNTANYYHVQDYITVSNTVRDSYFYGTYNSATQSYGVGCDLSEDLLAENNISQKLTDPFSISASCPGSVLAYNFAVNPYYSPSSAYMFPQVQFHSAGTSYTLMESNIGPQILTDDIHGTHDMDTMFRNFLTGYESNNGTLPYKNTSPAGISAFSRYMNYIGNVLGTATYHTAYQCYPTSAAEVSCGSSQFVDVFDIGWASNTLGQSQGSNNDTTTLPTLFRWGNYDVVTGSPRWCGNSSDSGWSTICGASAHSNPAITSPTSEVPTGDLYYPNSIPTLGDTGAGMNRMPSSFYNGVTGQFASCGTGLSFWLNPTSETCPPYPPIGPDVSGGTMLRCTSGTYNYSRVLSSSQCAGGTSTADMGGFANPIPAMVCYLNTMSGPPDGTGAMLSFNRASCYASDAASTTAKPSPPQSVNGNAVPQTN